MHVHVPLEFYLTSVWRFTQTFEYSPYLQKWMSGDFLDVTITGISKSKWMSTKNKYLYEKPFLT